MKRLHARPAAFLVFIVVAIIGIFLDRFTKTLAVIHLSDTGTAPVIPNFLNFELVYNRGAAWGMFEGGQAFFVFMMFLVVLAILIYMAYCKRHMALQVIALGFITAGAIGNGIDRATSGEVVDFIHTLFIEFPNFNIADSCITVGAILFVITVFFGEMDMGRKADAEADGVGADGEVVRCDSVEGDADTLPVGDVDGAGDMTVDGADDLTVDGADDLPADGDANADDAGNARGTDKNA